MNLLKVKVMMELLRVSQLHLYNQKKKVMASDFCKFS